MALKCLLKDVVPYLSAKKPQILISEIHTAYHVVCDPLPVGLTMRKMSAEENKLYSFCPQQDVNSLQTDLCGQVGVLHVKLLSCRGKNVHVFASIRDRKSVV